jgi:4-hydroxy-tetrahydrodipicolinate reductase
MKIAVMGAAGRMGRQLISAIAAVPGCEVSGATEAAGSPVIGKDIGELAGLEPLGISVSSDAAAVIAAADAIVDFTVPKATIAFARLAAQSGTAHIIGTTGFDKSAEDAIAEAAAKIAIVMAGNLSLGVNLLAAITQ